MCCHSAVTSRRLTHSSQAAKRRFIILMATVSPVARLVAFHTVPYVPSPSCRCSLYLRGEHNGAVQSPDMRPPQQKKRRADLNSKRGKASCSRHI